MDNEYIRHSVPGVVRGAEKQEHDGHARGRFFKQQKNRAERRAARLDPECQPSYGKYRGYEW